MISFRDMTFCSGDGCARFNTCPRALTDSVKDAADRWWKGPGAPISQFTVPKNLDCWATEDRMKQVEGGAE